MRSDIRATALYQEISDYCRDVRQPGTGQISDCSQLHASPDRMHVAFTATVAEHAEEEPTTRVALTELSSGSTSVVTFGPNSDKLPQFSVDGRNIAFLSDRREANRFQLYVFDRGSSAVCATPNIEGSVEYLRWSADGTRILLGVVGLQDPKSRYAKNLPSWIPSREPTHAPDDWRSCWLYDVATKSVKLITSPDDNIWDAAWCDSDTLVTVTSRSPGEGQWFSAHLGTLEISSGLHRQRYAPLNQLGSPVVSPSGETIAIVEGFCSDRGPPLGDLLLINAKTGVVRNADTRDIDVATAEWQSDQYLLVSGARGLETVVGLYDVATSTFSQIWTSKDVSIAGSRVSGLKRPGDCVLVVESFTEAPQLATVRKGRYRQIKSLDIGYAAATGDLAAVEHVTWPSADGLEIEGLLLRPHGPAPYPLILNIHGGPVQYWRPALLARKLLHVPLLLKRGFAIFLPNPRGSSGRGQAFSHRVIGDLGGGDALDLLSGLDALIGSGVTTPGRIGVTGVSYGGFMTAWLITQTDRFAAAVAISPHTNQVTAQLLSDMPQVISRLVDDNMGHSEGRYFARSPVLHVKKALAPTLNICGELDRCTPPEEAVQFHAALIEAGTHSALLSYPEEGHGVRRIPAALDCAARVTAWFTEHIPV